MLSYFDDRDTPDNMLIIDFSPSCHLISLTYKMAVRVIDFNLSAYFALSKNLNFTEFFMQLLENDNG